VSHSTVRSDGVQIAHAQRGELQRIDQRVREEQGLRGSPAIAARLLPRAPQARCGELQRSYELMRER